MVIGNLHNNKGITRGDAFSIRRTVTKIPAGSGIVTAILTLKPDINSPTILFQKLATLTNNQGTGFVEQTNTAGVGKARFDLSSADTLSMSADVDYPYDIQFTFSDGSKLTLESGVTSASQEVTV